VLDELLPIRDPVLIFALVAALMLLSPIVFGRWRLPGMIGLLISGAVLGPNALGVLARDQSFVLFGTVGLLYIMFVAALEIDLETFKRVRVHSIVFGLITFVLPQGVGTAMAHYVFGFDWMAAILLGSVLASHTLLAYPVASRLGVAKSTAVTAAIGGTILTDTLALLVLAVVAGASHGAVDSEFFVRLGLSLSAYVAVVLFGLPPVARWFLRRVASDGVSEFVFVLATVFFFASLSHAAGVEPIVGAFLTGLALNRCIPHGSTLMSRIQFVGEAIFIPFFLLSVGMLLDVRIFTAGLRSWIIAVGMLAAVTGSKWLAAQSTRVVLGYDKDAAMVVFGLTIAQAAATLAATMVGFEIGLFDDTVVNGTIVMIIVTCIVAPIATERGARGLAEREGARLEAGESGPRQRVLVLVEEPGRAARSVELAQMIRDAAQNQPIYPMAVVEEGHDDPEAIARAERLAARAALQLAAGNVEARPLTRIDRSVASGVVRARRELLATDVVIDHATATSSSEALLGGPLDKLLAEPAYTLVVCRLIDPVIASRRVVFAVPPEADLEQSFQGALKLVAHLCHHLGASMLVLAVKGHEQRVERRVRAVRPRIEATLKSLESWSTLQQKLADLLEPADLLVLCSGRRGGAADRASTPELAERFVVRFPEVNMVVLHPAEPDPGMRAAIATDGEIDETQHHLVHGHRGVLALHGESPERAAEALLLQSSLSEREDSADAALLALLADMLPGEQVTPGILFLHGESEMLSAASVAIGVRTADAEADGVRVVVIVVEPPRDPTVRATPRSEGVRELLLRPDSLARCLAAKSEAELLNVIGAAPRGVPGPVAVA
jgi:Kef-type K+ transport system membrane component KefB